MYRALRQVGQVAIASVVSIALLMFVYPLKVKQPASLASWHLRRISGYAPEGPPAFVFDIDGVLIQGGTVLPEAKMALAKLYTNNGMSLVDVQHLHHQFCLASFIVSHALAVPCRHISTAFNLCWWKCVKPLDVKSYS